MSIQPRPRRDGASRNFRVRHFSVRWLVVGALLFVAVTACDQSAQTQPSPNDPDADLTFGDLSIPITFENLQVLPENIARRELMHTMKVMSRSLGVRCKHCHDMKTEDYASDDIEAKRTARDMMHLVNALNTEVFTWEGAPEATCYLCHRRELEPPLVVPLTPEDAGSKPVIVPDPAIAGPVRP